MSHFEFTEINTKTPEALRASGVLLYVLLRYLLVLLRMSFSLRKNPLRFS